MKQSLSSKTGSCHKYCEFKLKLKALGVEIGDLGDELSRDKIESSEWHVPLFIGLGVEQLSPHEFTARFRLDRTFFFSRARENAEYDFVVAQTDRNSSSYATSNTIWP